MTGHGLKRDVFTDEKVPQFSSLTQLDYWPDELGREDAGARILDEFLATAPEPFKTWR